MPDARAPKEERVAWWQYSHASQYYVVVLLRARKKPQGVRSIYWLPPACCLLVGRLSCQPSTARSEAASEWTKKEKLMIAGEWFLMRMHQNILRSCGCLSPRAALQNTRPPHYYCYCYQAVSALLSHVHVVAKKRWLLRYFGWSSLALTTMMADSLRSEGGGRSESSNRHHNDRLGPRISYYWQAAEERSRKNKKEEGGGQHPQPRKWRAHALGVRGGGGSLLAPPPGPPAPPMHHVV